MNRYLSFIFLLFTLSYCQRLPNTMPKDTAYEDYPIYKGKDLGLTYTATRSTFKVWAPGASTLILKIYDQGAGGNLLEEHKMQKTDQGVWIHTSDKDMKGLFYAFQAKVDGQWKNEVVDPYAKAVGINGDRGQVVDLKESNPSGWEIDKQVSLKKPNDAVIYELHVRDISMHENSGIRQKGKFLGLVETKSKSPEGNSTGLDHIKDLGITHVHLLPSFDYRSIDESKLEENKFNWGYDPKNYNAPEGSYSTDPSNGLIRIKEFKTMVQRFHEQGIGVILDVAYNHTGETELSNFNQLVPGYYYRQNKEGGFSDASACGNETASERAMFRKFMLESIEYWMKEYHIDGFRFDLMGIHDITTMNEISKLAHQINPNVLLYGEGWTAGSSPLSASQQALKANTHKLDRIAAFSDDIRDAIKGHVFTPDAPGFVSGKEGLKESIKFGIVGSIWHPDIAYKAINYSDSAWAKVPSQSISYASCHDNHTLWDKLALSRPEASEEERKEMHKLALGIVITTQGIPFLHAGSEIRRSKKGEENSFESPDEINSIDWSLKEENKELYTYIKDLLRLRKYHPAFRINDAGELRQKLKFLPTESENAVAYQLGPRANGDQWVNIVVAYNGSDRNQIIAIPPGEYTQVVNQTKVNTKGIRKYRTNTVLVPPYSMAILHSKVVNAVE